MAKRPDEAGSINQDKLDESRKTSSSPEDGAQIKDESPSKLEKTDTTLEGGLLLNEDEAFALIRSGRAPAAPIFVTFSKHDPENPRNFPKLKKWYITCFASFLNVITCLCAGGYSSAADMIVEHFGVSAEVGTLGLSMYILGQYFYGSHCEHDYVLRRSQASRLDPCFWHHLASTSAEVQSTLARGSSSSSSKFLWLWLRTLGL
jgi:hypothetical protein